MTIQSSYTGDQLTTALHTLGVDFIMGKKHGKRSLYKKPDSLIAALANSPEARLRLSLIPLFLEHPEFSIYVQAVSNRIEPATQITLQCYYTAAVLLQKQNSSQLNALIGSKPSLPNYFSSRLGLELTEDCEENLRGLGLRHQELSKSQVNWLGTYQHAFQVWTKGLEFQRG